MSTHLRQWLTWLLLIALPLQGYAAATMLHCAPSRAAVSSPLHGNDAGLDEVPCHPSADATQHGAAANPKPDSAAESKCSACAACCVGMALPACALVIEASAPERARVTACAAPPTDFVSAGLERPPR